MNQGKRLSQILIIVVLCVLIIYAGFHMKIEVSEEAQMKINSFLFEKSEKMYLAGFTYLSDRENISFGQWLANSVMNTIPLGMYVQGKTVAEVDIEDQDIYEMILEQQANDENMIDENGKLVQSEQAKTSETTSKGLDTSLEKLKNYEYLIQNFYTVDGSTSVNKKLLDAETLLSKDMTIDMKENGPKVLIYHTHSQEAFADSQKGDTSTTIVGMGAYLSDLLNETYGISTMHHEGVYDLVNGKLDRSKAYQLAETEITKILKENPTIEVVIDLHRDGVGANTHLVTEVDGKKTAQIMFFNGLSRTKANGDISYLYNPYIEDNLAFSLQMQIAATKMYPGFTRHIYLKSYRYNMHLMPKTLLIEAGAQTNTVEEMRNAMELLAATLDSVLDP